MEASPGFIFSVLSFIGMFTVLVFIHEFGHFYTARKLGVRVDVFSIGFGQEIFGWYDKHGTRWKICWVPLGGYVKFFGDAGAASNASDKLDQMSADEKAVSFHHKPLWSRAAIVAAGPFINLAFAIAIFTGFYMAYGESYAPPVVTSVVENYPAEKAGVQLGDVITSIDGNSIERFDDISYYIRPNMGEVVVITVERDGKLVNIVINPLMEKLVDRFGNDYSEAKIGLGGRVTEVLEHGLFSAVGASVVKTKDSMALILRTLGQIVMGVRSIKDMGGPVKIAQITGQVASLGMERFIYFMAMISLNLGLVNLLPIPMLDGGHLMIYGLEGIRRKPVSQRLQEYAFIFGFLFLISLTIVLTWNDLSGLGLW